MQCVTRNKSNHNVKDYMAVAELIAQIIKRIEKLCMLEEKNS